MEYRRDRTPGGVFFFTVVTHARRKLFADPENVERLRVAFRHVKATYPFRIDAIVVLPDHLHCIWTLPEDDHDFSLRWSLLKGNFTNSLADWTKPARDATRRTRRVWQQRFWEHRIRDDGDFRRHCDYIHWNPVRHGLVSSPSQWPYSSFGRFVEAGLYPGDWGANGGIPDDLGAGEPGCCASRRNLRA